MSTRLETVVSESSVAQSQESICPYPKLAIAIGIIVLLGAAIGTWAAYDSLGNYAFAIAGCGGFVGIALIILGSCSLISKKIDFKKFSRLPNETLASFRGRMIEQLGGGKSVLCGYSFIEMHFPEAKAAILDRIQRGTLTTKEEMALGVIYGKAVGDAVGAPFEFLDYDEAGYLESDTKFDMLKEKFVGIKQKYDHFNLKPGQWTDDTSMGLCMADVLIDGKGELDGVQLQYAFRDWWEHGYDNAFTQDFQGSVGLGGNIHESFTLSRKDQKFGREKTGSYPTQAGDQHTSGNGSLMRLGPVALVARSQEEARKLAATQSRVTHKGDEAAACAELMASIIYELMHAEEGVDKRNLLVNVTQNFVCSVKSVNDLATSKDQSTNLKDHSSESWNWQSEDFTFNATRLEQQPDYIGSYAMDALSMALHCVYSTHSFEEAVLKAATKGGDADTVGAITGQIAGALYGFNAIPTNWISAVQQWDRGGEIAARAYLLVHIHDTVD